MDKLGLDSVVARLAHYQALYGDAFKPADILLKMRDERTSFYG